MPRPHGRFSAELLQAFLVLPEHRGLGLAEPALWCALDHIHRALRVEFVMWLVHHDNEYKLKVSNNVAGTPIGETDSKRFVTYIEP